ARSGTRGAGEKRAATAQRAFPGDHCQGPDVVFLSSGAGALSLDERVADHATGGAAGRLTLIARQPATESSAACKRAIASDSGSVRSSYAAIGAERRSSIRQNGSGKRWRWSVRKCDGSTPTATTARPDSRESGKSERRTLP